MNFFNDLDDALNKTKYQGLLIEIGISRFNVLVPLEKSERFAENVIAEKPQSKDDLVTLVEKFNGQFEK